MSSSPLPDPAGEQAPATLSPQLGELLVELSTGVHRYAMYPPDHPSLSHSAERIVGRLALCLVGRSGLHIGVARNQLVVEGAATDPRHPVLSDLARRLHDHQIGALSFRAGVDAREVERLLRSLSNDPVMAEGPPGRTAEPDGTTEGHVTIYPIGYDRLTIQDGSGPDEERMDRAIGLWLALAEATMAPDAPYAPAQAPDETALAEAIGQGSRERGYDQVVADHLHQITKELRDNPGRDARAVRDRVSQLIRQLDDQALHRLLEMGGDSARRRELVLDANQTLAVDAVVKLLEAAASAAGQTVSTSMVRLLTKLSLHAREGAELVRGQADAALRENVDRLLADWELEDPNPAEYTQILDGMARVSPVLEDDARKRRPGPGMELTSEEYELSRQAHPGALRLVEMALEVDAWGPTIQAAVSELVDRGRVGRLVNLLADASEGSGVATRIRSFLNDPEQLRRLLSADEVDEAWLQILVREMGREAVPPLMDALAESESRSVRRKVFDSLVALQKDLSAEIVRRLDDPRWYVVRNMLALVQRLDRPPPGFEPMRFLGHADTRVRREAFPLAVKDEACRSEVLAQGLASDDERLIHMSLLEVQRGAPVALVPSLVRAVGRHAHPPPIRTLAIRALQEIESTEVRDALLDVAAPVSGLFGKRKVSSEKSAHVVAAMEVLAERWAHDEEVTTVLQAAKRSADPEMRRAASPTKGA